MKKIKPIWFYICIFVVLIVSLSVETAMIRDMEERIDAISEKLERAQEKLERVQTEVKNQCDELSERLSDLKEDLREVQEQVGMVEGIEPARLYSEDEIELIALCTLGEAQSEPELGKRLVIDTILNRVDDSGFANTIREVVYAPKQFTCMSNGRVDSIQVDDATRALVIEELNNRTDRQVLYFRSGHYHDFGTPLYKVGNHYFSTR